MRCYCYEEREDFILCVEEAEDKYHEIIKGAYFEKCEDRFIKKYSKNIVDKDVISENFTRLGEKMFSQIENRWEEALEIIIDKCAEHDIEYYLIGSCADAVRGARVKPHDIDIMVNTKDFYKIRDVFIDYMVEPFEDNGGDWVVRYFGRLCICGMQIDIAADEKNNADVYNYEKESWRENSLRLEPFQNRYDTEVLRGRKDRIKLLDEIKK